MDYLRQLRNDEKRCTFSMVGTLDSKLANTTDGIPLFVVPRGSTIARIYAVTKEAFAAGATVAVGIAVGSDVGTIYFAALALDTANEVTMGDGDSAGKYVTDNSVEVEFNTAAVDSATGEAQIVVEFTEIPVCAGSYTK